MRTFHGPICIMTTAKQRDIKLLESTGGQGLGLRAVQQAALCSASKFCTRPSQLCMSKCNGLCAKYQPHPRTLLAQKASLVHHGPTPSSSSSSTYRHLWGTTARPTSSTSHSSERKRLLFERKPIYSSWKCWAGEAGVEETGPCCWLTAAGSAHSVRPLPSTATGSKPRCIYSPQPEALDSLLVA
jgi:hypothetical protein